MLHIVGEDCMTKFCTSLSEHVTNIILKRKIATVNKRRTKIALECDNMLHLWKRIHEKVC